MEEKQYTVKVAKDGYIFLTAESEDDAITKACTIIKSSPDKIIWSEDPISIVSTEEKDFE